MSRTASVHARRGVATSPSVSRRGERPVPIGSRQAGPQVVMLGSASRSRSANRSRSPSGSRQAGPLVVIPRRSSRASSSLRAGPQGEIPTLVESFDEFRLHLNENLTHGELAALIRGIMQSSDIQAAMEELELFLAGATNLKDICCDQNLANLPKVSNVFKVLTSRKFYMFKKKYNEAAAHKIKMEILKMMREICTAEKARDPYLCSAEASAIKSLAETERRRIGIAANQDSALYQFLRSDMLSALGISGVVGGSLGLVKRLMITNVFYSIQEALSSSKPKECPVTPWSLNPISMASGKLEEARCAAANSLATDILPLLSGGAKGIESVMDSLSLVLILVISVLMFVSIFVILKVKGGNREKPAAAPVNFPSSRSRSRRSSSPASARPRSLRAPSSSGFPRVTASGRGRPTSMNLGTGGPARSSRTSSALGRPRTSSVRRIEYRGDSSE
jgi:hypothetical protein